MIYLASYGIVVSIVVFILAVKNTNLRTKLNRAEKNYLSLCNDFKELAESTMRNSAKIAQLEKEINETSEEEQIIEELIKFTEQIADKQKRAKDKIEENKDDREKLLGDRVIIWDFSFATLENGNKGVYDNYEQFKPLVEKLSKQEAIVIKTNESFIGKVNELGLEKVCDLLVEFPDKTRIYTPSIAVRRIDNYEK